MILAKIIHTYIGLMLKLVKRRRQKEEESEDRWKSERWRDFPGGPVVKNPPSNVEDGGLIPGRGTRNPHTLGQLNPCHN